MEDSQHKRELSIENTIYETASLGILYMIENLRHILLEYKNVIIQQGKRELLLFICSFSTINHQI